VEKVSLKGGVQSEKERWLPLNVSTESLPSEDAHASIAPSSWGAQETELTIYYIS
jgi:hypothetical protein